MSTDPRVEAASRSFASGYDSYPGPAKRSIHEEVTPIIAAADRADREQGIHRVKVDDATVERAARELFLLENPDGSWAKHHAMFGGFSKYEHAARAVLAALTGAGS